MLKKYLLPLCVLLFVGFVGWRVIANGRATAPGNSDNPDTETSRQTSKSSPSFDKSKFSTSDPNSIWVVVNKKRPLNPLEYAPSDLVNIGGQQMRKEAATALQQMFAAAAKEGLQLQALSGYRSYATQQTVYANEVAANGQEVADTQSARPGHSEHQTGLTMDLGGGGCGIEDCFGDTPHGKWVAANAYKFGFHIRYPQGKDAITGYRYEPWHVRYVGKELAAEMKKQNVLTLEEFFGL